MECTRLELTHCMYYSVPVCSSLAKLLKVGRKPTLDLPVGVRIPASQFGSAQVGQAALCESMGSRRVNSLFPSLKANVLKKGIHPSDPEFHPERYPSFSETV